MQNFTFFLLLCLLAFGCQDNSADRINTEPVPAFSLSLTDNPELSYENLRLIPVIADEEFLDGQEVVANLKNLAEGMDISRFRITEHKPFGSREDREAVNLLTVQNKSRDTIFLMEGDVVEGGRQDRILAEDMVVPPRTIRNISVFCVEHGRWRYEGASENSAPIAVNGHREEQNRKIQAFTGYYNVAGNQVRRVVNKTDNQQAVWQEVDAVHSAFNVSAPTKAYTGLETSEEFTRERNAYLNFFKEKFADSENVIGITAVSGNKILGTDIFGHPNLFKKQYKALIYSYVAEAMAEKNTEETLSENKLNLYEKDLLYNFRNDKKAKFMWEGKTVHFVSL